MESDNKSQGVEKFVQFVKAVPEGLTDFDYFHLLDHISTNKLDKDLIAAIFCESKNNKTITNQIFMNFLLFYAKF